MLKTVVLLNMFVETELQNKIKHANVYYQKPVAQIIKTKERKKERREEGKKERAI